MKKKNFVIIGGGLSGCTAALYLRKKGHEVKIYEKSSNLGGVARDLEFNNEIFCNGPNYLKPNSLLIQLIKKEKFFNKIIKIQNISYGSFTDIFNKETVSKKFAHPVSLLHFENEKRLYQPKNLSNRINLYPKYISKNLTTWTKKFENDISKLHQDCSHLMGFGRIHFKNDDKQILILKKKSKLFDEILGIPNHKKLEKICVPINGFNNFFNVLKRHLKKQGVKIENSSKVNIINNNKKIFFSHLKKNIKADYFILASNPIPLINALNSSKLDNPIIKFEVIAFDLVNYRNKIENFYIQVFSKKSNIFRIYLFNINNKNKIVIEILKNNLKIDIKDEINFAKKILLKFNLKFEIKNPINSIKQIRHLLFTVNDYKKFIKFENKSNDLKIIGGGWYLLGSKLKMDYIKNKIDNIII